jgi:RimJ/RimL family protein N-acetyltransferase
MELLRTPRLVLRHWEESDLQAFYDLYSRVDVMLALTDVDNVRSQAVAARLGLRDEGTTDRWFGLTARQFSKTIAAGNGGDSPAPTPAGHPEL